jgi:hypothetical protein
MSQSNVYNQNHVPPALLDSRLKSSPQLQSFCWHGALHSASAAIKYDLDSLYSFLHKQNAIL